MAPRLVAVASATALTASLVLGCGGETSSGPDPGTGAALAAPINLADCTDWQQATEEQRLGTIEQIREYVGRPISGTQTKGTVLDDDEAYELFESYCENEFARAFKLYKLYSRAAAFGG